MKLFANRLTQRVGERPTTSQTMTDDRRWYPGQFSPFSRCHASSTECEKAIVAFIPSLLFPGRPAAVLWTVVFGVVNAIQRVLRTWPRADVLEERLEGISPALAHGNAAASVLVVGGIIGIVATLDHPRPSCILAAFRHPVFDSMEQPSSFVPKTATASNTSVKQMVRDNDCGIPTDAAAQPGTAFEFPFYRLQRRESFEFLIGEIQRTHAGIIAESGKTRQQNSVGGN